MPRKAYERRRYGDALEAWALAASLAKRLDVPELWAGLLCSVADLQGLEEPGKAEATLSLVLREVPQHTAARRRRGLLREQQGDLDGARKDLVLALQENFMDHQLQEALARLEQKRLAFRAALSVAHLWARSISRASAFSEARPLRGMARWVTATFHLFLRGRTPPWISRIWPEAQESTNPRRGQPLRHPSAARVLAGARGWRHKATACRGG